MTSRGPSPVWAWLFLLSAILGTLASLFLAITFTGAWTDYVVYFGLANPKGTAGQLFGSLVAWPLTFSLAFGVYWFWRHVLSQITAYAEASRKWEALLEKETGLDESGKPKRLDEKAAEELVQEIARLQPAYARVVRAAKSWLDPSPDSDAEMVIEGVANRCRQHLSLLQAVASVLVLIGLVGNFFGLSEAVREMPRLTEAAQPVPQASRTPTTNVSRDGQYFNAQTKVSEVPPPATETANKSVEGISKGLEVVVVSSVLGIGGMIGLLLFVAVFRNFFNHLVGEEVLLMATEIGTAVRPGLTPAGLGDAESLQKNLQSLHTTLDTLNQRLATFEAKDRDLGKLTDQLDLTLKRHLEAEDTRFSELRQALTDLTQFLESRNETLTGVLSAAVGTGRQLEGLAISVNKLGTGLTQMVDSQQQTLVDLEAYAGLVRSMASEEHEKRDERHRELVDSLTGQLDQRMQGWLARVDEQREAYLKQSQDAFDQVEQSLGKLVGELTSELGRQSRESREHQSKLSQASEKQLARLQEDWGSLVKGLLADLDRQSRESREHRSELSQETGKRLAELQQGWAELMKSLESELDRQGQETRQHHSELSQATEKRLAELQENWGKLAGGLIERLEQGEANGLTARQEADEKLTARLAEIESSLTRDLGRLSDSLSERLPEAGRALETVAEGVRASQRELHDELKRVSELLGDLSKGQGEATSAARAVLDEATRTLNATRERILELQDRWNVNLEELAREIFEQWVSRQAPDGALAVELGKLSSTLSQLVDKQSQVTEDRRKVCFACGLANNPEETYCAKCGESLQNAVAPGSFPVRFLAERLEGLQRALEAQPPAPASLDPALLERFEAALQALRTDLQNRPEPVVVSPPGDNTEPVVERLDRLIALVEQERKEPEPVRRGWSFLPRRNS